MTYYRGTVRQRIHHFGLNPEAVVRLSTALQDRGIDLDMAPTMTYWLLSKEDLGPADLKPHSLKNVTARIGVLSHRSDGRAEPELSPS